jgi:hypothetical protein
MYTYTSISTYMYIYILVYIYIVLWAEGGGKGSQAIHLQALCAYLAHHSTSSTLSINVFASTGHECLARAKLCAVDT